MVEPVGEHMTGCWAWPVDQVFLGGERVPGELWDVVVVWDNVVIDDSEIFLFLVWKGSREVDEGDPDLGLGES